MTPAEQRRARAKALAAEGLKVKQIAHELGVSAETVRQYINPVRAAARKAELEAMKSPAPRFHCVRRLK